MFSFAFSVDFLDRDKVNSFQKEFKNKETIQIKTSGSTGQPKEIDISVAQMKASAQMTNNYFSFNEKCRALLCLSIDTIAGKMMIARANEGNFQLQIQQPTARPLEHCEIPLDFVAFVPAQLLESVFNDVEKLKRIRVILVGGGPISPELEQLLVVHKITVYHSFGMTETLSHIAIRKVGWEGTDSFEALGGVTFSEQNGNLVLDAPHLSIVQLMTNDKVQLLSDTQFKWIGRSDFVINTGGYKVQMEELESKISPFISCPFFIWKERQVKWGEIVVLCLEKDIDLNLEQMFSTEAFQSWEKPKKTYVYTTFLRSESGKILRKLTFEQKPLKIHEPRP